MSARRSGAAVAGVITRGTTAHNRLRRVDRWILAHAGPALRATSTPLVVDLGFGRIAQTTIELFERLQAVSPDVTVTGLEIDPVRVAEAAAHERPGLDFRHGGFELAGLTDIDVIRAMNVLRQYGETEVAPAWERLARGLRPGGVLVEGTCDELGRIGSWVAIRPGDGGAVPVVPDCLVFSARCSSLGDPARFAERLPKALIHRNVPGEGIHAFLGDWSRAWKHQAAQEVFGPRARFVAAAATVKADGWPVIGGPARWRLGEVTVAWEAVRPGCR